MAPKSGPPANPIVVIPARLASQRLPSKPLADIHGEPMIVHVWRRAIAADFARVVVACADAEIVEVVEKVGGEAVLTDPKIPSGTDRVQAPIATPCPTGARPWAPGSWSPDVSAQPSPPKLQQCA